MIKIFGAFALWLLASALASAQTPDSYFQISAGGKVYSSKVGYQALCDSAIADISAMSLANAGFSSKLGSCDFLAAGYGPGKFRMVYGMHSPYNQNSVTGGYYQCTVQQPVFNPATNLCTPGPPDPCKDTNPYIRRFYYTSGGPYVAPTNYAGCKVSPTQMKVCRKDPAANNQTYCMWEFKRTGLPYNEPTNTGDGSTPTEQADDGTMSQTQSPPIRNPSGSNPDCPSCLPCPAGTVQAGIDSSSIPICIGTGTDPVQPPKTPTTTTTPTTSTTKPDGSVVAVSSTAQQNSDGSTTTTTTTTTTSPGGAITVSKDTVTSNTPGGTQGRADTPQQDQNNLCKQNPNLTICQNSSVSGSCGQVSCTGDAIQCATLRAAEAMRCNDQKDRDELQSSPLKTLGEAALNGSDPMKASLPTPSKGTQVSVPSSLDQSGWLGQGSPFEDVTFSIQGKSITIPFAKWTSYLVALRYAVMVVALLASMRILGGTILRE